MTWKCHTCGEEFEIKGDMFAHKKTEHERPGSAVVAYDHVKGRKEGIRGRPSAVVEYDDGKGRKEGIRVQRVEQQLIFEATIDCSGSMAGAKMTTAVDALRSIFHDVMRPSDFFGLLRFSNEATQVHRIMRRDKVDFARDQAALVDHVGGGTALYDAITTSIQNMRKEEPFVRHKLHAGHVTALHLVITDGEDNASKTSLANLKEMLQNPNIQGYHMHIIGVQMDDDGKAALTDLATAGGGKRATLHFADSLDDFRALVQLVRQALEIVLEINDSERGRQVIRAVADRHNFREVLEELSKHSLVVRHNLAGLLRGIERMGLGWH